MRMAVVFMAMVVPMVVTVVVMMTAAQNPEHSQRKQNYENAR